MTKRFFIIEDYTSCSIWDTFILESMLTLPSKPRGWERPKNTLPEGDWTLACGHHQMASDGAYEKAGIPKPTFEQLPAVFCVDDHGVRDRYRVTAQQALDFVRENLSTPLFLGDPEMVMNLSVKLTALLTNLETITEAANVADKAYNVSVGTPEAYKPFGADNPSAVQNNAVAFKAVINASLAIAAMRWEGKVTEERRLQAILDIAYWHLNEVEVLVARLYANATWWARNISRDLKRATRSVCMDFTELPPNEIGKDDALLKAVANWLHNKLAS